jgi:tetratricopeptide (TPR) repeat protein
MSKKNDNFIDKTFSVLADLLLKLLPATSVEKKAFSYYRSGLNAQTEGRYAEALTYYYESLKFEEDQYDRSYILLNIGIIYSDNANFSTAIEYFHQALVLNTKLHQAWNYIAVIYHWQGVKATEKQEFAFASLMYEKAAAYWQKALYLCPEGYPQARNWLTVTGKWDRFISNR